MSVKKMTRKELIKAAIKYIEKDQIMDTEEAVKRDDVIEFIKKVKKNLQPSIAKDFFNRRFGKLKIIPNNEAWLEMIYHYFQKDDGENYIALHDTETECHEFVDIEIPKCLYSYFEVCISEFPMGENTKKIIDSMNEDEWEDYREGGFD